MKQILLTVLIIALACNCKGKPAKTDMLDKHDAGKPEVSDQLKEGSKLSQDEAITIDADANTVQAEAINERETALLQEYLNIADYHIWSTEKQQDALETIYKTGSIENYLTLSAHLLKIKLQEDTLQKTVSFYNPLNIPASENNIEWLKTVHSTYPSLVTLQTVNMNLVPDSPQYPLVFAVKANAIDSVTYLLQLKAVYTKKDYYYGDLYTGWPLSLISVAKTKAMQEILSDYGYEAEILLKYEEHGQTLTAIGVKDDPADEEDSDTLEAGTFFTVKKVSAYVNNENLSARWIYIETETGKRGWIFNDNYNGDDKVRFPNRMIR